MDSDYLNMYERLRRYNNENVYPFHMPGHKRNTGKAPAVEPYELDITEIDGFDDLHHPEGCIKEAQERAAAMYGTLETHFLVNGCTAGILTAVSACCGDKTGILIARNCHKSVYNAVMINRLKPYYVWVQGRSDDISGVNGYSAGAADISRVLSEYSDIGCVVITSPTYEGYVSDVNSIAEVVHGYGIPLIVDEAHGAHFPWNDIFPDSAIRMGADIVIHGIHKTLPSYTQTALLHVCTDRVDTGKIKRYLSVYQSSSPSYLLMGSIDYCLDYIRNHGKKEYDIYISNLIKLYDRLEKLQYVSVLPYCKGRDASKIVICTDRLVIDGLKCYNILRCNYRLQPEMALGEYVILMTSVWDNEDAYDRLVYALEEMDALYRWTESDVDCIRKDESMVYPHNEYVMGIYEAADADSEYIELENAAGKVSCEMVYIYPPGIPYIVPGERVSQECIELLRYYSMKGYEIKGMEDKNGKYLRIVRQHIKKVRYDICNNGKECDR